MKKTAFALLFLALPALADNTASLKDNMKAIGQLFGAIKMSDTDATQNAANSANAAKLVALFQTVRGQVPDSISSLPDQQQAAALADYQSIIDSEISFAGQLKADFDTNNNSAAVGIVTQMDSSKRDGHQKYNKH